jgi:hypothetical protein
LGSIPYAVPESNTPDELALESWRGGRNRICPAVQLDRSTDNVILVSGNTQVICFNVTRWQKFFLFIVSVEWKRKL